MVVVKFQLNKNEEEKLNKVNLIFSRNVAKYLSCFIFEKKKKFSQEKDPYVWIHKIKLLTTNIAT